MRERKARVETMGCGTFALHLDYLRFPHPTRHDNTLTKTISQAETCAPFVNHYSPLAMPPSAASPPQTSGFMDEIRKIPPVTRTLVAATIAISGPVMLQLISPYKILFVWKYVKQGQVGTERTYAGIAPLLTVAIWTAPNRYGGYPPRSSWEVRYCVQGCL